ncbi:MAG: hypothetical protein KF868_00510 [Acidobacteria bacterium]|nr:hypothetical protein [Acidobacteriota bacterium]MCW5969404.1 hypothetical protein [Blastocatellales bacterium]
MIIAERISVGDEWGEGRQQNDDITFVVLKMHYPAHPNNYGVCRHEDR